MQPSTRAELQEWMTRLADGDRASFDPLYAALWPRVRRFAERALGGAADPDDVAEEVLIKVLSRATEFDPERDAVSWVLGIAAYECKTARQRARRKREAPQPDPAVASDAPSPEEAVIARDLAGAAEAIVGTLRAADRDVLAAVVSGRRPDVAAATFRKRLERALSRVRLAWRSKHGTE